jgi:hypothetical protein
MMAMATYSYIGRLFATSQVEAALYRNQKSGKWMDFKLLMSTQEA